MSDTTRRGVDTDDHGTQLDTLQLLSTNNPFGLFYFWAPSKFHLSIWSPLAHQFRLVLPSATRNYGRWCSRLSVRMLPSTSSRLRKRRSRTPLPYVDNLPLAKVLHRHAFPFHPSPRMELSYSSPAKLLQAPLSPSFPATPLKCQHGLLTH